MPCRVPTTCGVSPGRLAVRCSAIWCWPGSSSRSASPAAYDVSTLYFETDTGDGFSEPQITIGLLADQAGFPGMISEASQKAIEEAGLSFILGMRIPRVPYVVAQWGHEHPGEDIPNGQVFTQPWPAGPTGERRDQVIYYQYRHDRARRTLRGIDEQICKAEKAVAGKTRSSATGSSKSPAAPGRSTGRWRTRRGHWPG
jgi:hypothetical protein